MKQGAATLASFAYDSSGRRASKTAAGATTTYVYDGSEFLEERPNAGALKRYVYGPEIDQVLAQVVSGATSYNVADHLGSVARTTDGTGTPTLTREYDPWGNLLQGSATGGYSFTGREWEPETGLYYYRARYYDPRMGRFNSEDPLERGGGHNFYGYVSNSPLGRTDPSGLVALNLFSRDDKTFSEAADAELYTSSLGVFGVAGHGNTTGMYDMRGIKWSTNAAANSAALTARWLSPEGLAALIKGHPAWNAGCDVYLLSCDVGSASFAQKLAKLLRVDVWAPTTKILWKKDWGMAPGYPPGKTWGVQGPGILQRFSGR